MSSNSADLRALAILARQVREVTLRVFDAVDSNALTWTPPGTSNHILWHMGHAVWVADVLTIEPITGRGELPPGWEEQFGQDSRPSTFRNWPDRTVVRSLLESQLHRVLELFNTEQETIAARADQLWPNIGWPLLDGIIHGWHDEARHQGEVHLLQKLWRAASAG